MGTTPNFNTAGTGSHNAGSNPSNDSGTSNTGGSGTSGRTDDVSFGRSMGARGQSGSIDSAADSTKNAVDSAADSTKNVVDSAKDTVKRGMGSAQDAMEQLQQKAGDVTSRLINNIDVDDLTQKLEAQVREHPARTLLMAVGAGFMLGRAAKR